AVDQRSLEGLAHGALLATNCTNALRRRTKPASGAAGHESAPAANLVKSEATLLGGVAECLGHRMHAGMIAGERTGGDGCILLANLIDDIDVSHVNLSGYRMSLYPGRSSRQGPVTSSLRDSSRRTPSVRRHGGRRPAGRGPRGSSTPGSRAGCGGSPPW